jgi:hypothetical protein
MGQETHFYGTLEFTRKLTGEELAAFMDLIVRDDLSPLYAGALRINKAKSGLIYRSEKTYDMVAGVNFIIANGRDRIPGFGLRGEL